MPAPLRQPILLLLLMFPMAVLNLQCVSFPEQSFYVSQDGNDEWSGLIGAPGLLGTDGPFRTLGRAKRAVREADKANLYRVNVFVREGIYRMENPLHLTEEDGGPGDTRIVWSAYPGEYPILSGSRVISDFSPVIDSTAASRIDPRYLDQVVQTDLRQQGIDDFGDFSDENGPGLELFFGGERMRRARYPNEGYLRITEVPQVGDSLMNEGSWQWTRNGIPVGRHFGVLRFDDDRLRRWAPSSDIWMHGYFVWDWRDGFQRVAKIDGEKGLVYPASPHHSYGYHQDQPVYFFNVLEELDRPGEWVIDTKEGLLYFWPPASVDSATVTVSVLDRPLLLLDSTSNVSVEGFIFEESRSEPVVVRGGDHVVVAGNTIRNAGTTGIVVEGGTGHLITGNDVH
ncbi:MAG: right-handed parallel beta-helix repeat-containing protein, partial [Rhodothermia bacterium]